MYTKSPEMSKLGGDKSVEGFVWLYLEKGIYTRQLEEAVSVGLALIARMY